MTFKDRGGVGGWVWGLLSMTLGGKGCFNEISSTSRGKHSSLPRFWNSDCRIAEAPEAGSEEDCACRAGESNPRSKRDVSVGKQLGTHWQKRQLREEESWWR